MNLILFIIFSLSSFSSVKSDKEASFNIADLVKLIVSSFTNTANDGNRAPGTQQNGANGYQPSGNYFGSLLAPNYRQSEDDRSENGGEPPPQKRFTTKKSSVESTTRSQTQNLWADTTAPTAVSLEQLAGGRLPEPGASLFPPRYPYKMENITFASKGTKVVGRLFVPELHKIAEFPAVTFLGPVFSVKEQAPFQYATRLASMGFVTLIFDPRNHGESDGEPRRWESPKMKVEDVSASIDFLQNLPSVDRNNIFAVGICQGASVMLEATAAEWRIKALATVAGNYVNKLNYVNGILDGAGGESMWQMRLSRGTRAKRTYEITGKVEERDYYPIVDPERKDVALPQYNIWLWYHGWYPGSNWENRYAVMSDLELMTWDAGLAAGNLTTPWLQIHSDNSDGPETARQFYKMALGLKNQAWMGETGHTQFYSDPYIIDQACEKIYWWFKSFTERVL